MCYNVLCEKYATTQMYGYCPSWALSWDYRKKVILGEIRHYTADIITLQVRAVLRLMLLNYFLRLDNSFCTHIIIYTTQILQNTMVNFFVKCNLYSLRIPYILYTEAMVTGEQTAQAKIWAISYKLINSPKLGRIFCFPWANLYFPVHHWLYSIKQD